MVERLFVGSEAPQFTLFNDKTNRTFKLDEKTLKHQTFILLYFYSQSTNVQPIEQFYHNHIHSSFFVNAHIWAILIEDSDDPLLIQQDVELIQNEMKDNAYPFDILIDRDGQVAWNYNVYNRDTKQGRQAVFIIAPKSTDEDTVPIIVHMQIVDKSIGKIMIDWKEVEKSIVNLIENKNLDTDI